MKERNYHMSHPFGTKGVTSQLSSKVVVCKVIPWQKRHCCKGGPVIIEIKALDASPSLIPLGLSLPHSVCCLLRPPLVSPSQSFGRSSATERVALRKSKDLMDGVKSFWGSHLALQLMIDTHELEPLCLEQHAIPYQDLRSNFRGRSLFTPFTLVRSWGQEVYSRLS